MHPSIPTDVIFLADDVYKKYMIEFMRGVVQNLATTPPPQKKKPAKKKPNQQENYDI